MTRRLNASVLATLISIAALIAPCSTLATVVDAVEYYHAGFDHYFVTATPSEISALDGGAFGGVWRRTGQTFKVHDAAATGTSPVCRFFSTSYAPKSSHFYTASECAALMANRNWQYETVGFHVANPSIAGVCASGTVNLYRLYNNSRSGAPNHRYTTSTTVRSEMIGRGWTPEGYGVGVVACSPTATSPPSDLAYSKTFNLIGGTWAFNYYFGRSYTDTFRFTSMIQGTDPSITPWYATGTNKYGELALGGWGVQTNKVMILSRLSTAWDVYVFDYPTANTATGCYYFDYGQANPFATCTTLTGIRTGASVSIAATDFLDETLDEKLRAALVKSKAELHEMSPDDIDMLKEMKRLIQR